MSSYALHVQLVSLTSPFRFAFGGIRVLTLCANMFLSRKDQFRNFILYCVKACGVFFFFSLMTTMYTVCTQIHADGLDVCVVLVYAIYRFSAQSAFFSSAFIACWKMLMNALMVSIIAMMMHLAKTQLEHSAVCVDVATLDQEDIVQVKGAIVCVLQIVPLSFVSIM